MASRYFEWNHGPTTHKVHYTRRGMGDPFLLVHNLYPGASADEFQHNINHLSRHFTVYAIDLLGFGSSEAPNIKYTALLYTDLIRDFCTNIIRTPTQVAAAGLSCAYVAQAAVWRPELFQTLAMICPRSEPTGLDRPRWVAPIQRFVLNSEMLGAGFYDTMSSPHSIRLFLDSCFHSRKNITTDLVTQLHENAAQAGSIHAYASLVTGYLDCELLKTLPHLDKPVLLVWGRQARPTPVEHSVRLTALLRNGRIEVIGNAGAWVHHEQSAQVNRFLTSFASGITPAKQAVTA